MPPVARVIGTKATAARRKAIIPLMPKPAKRRQDAATPSFRHRQNAAAMKKIPQQNAD
jgi:hypothetical protein